MTGDVTTVRIAHSPDSDDAFMFYALTQGVLDAGGLKIEDTLSDIETLNARAFDGVYEITALSFHAYAYLSGRYQIMPCGASFGDGYGPVVVAAEEMTRSDLVGATVAIPGKLTTAHLTLKLWQPAVKTVVVPFDEVMETITSGGARAGVVIHEGQLTYAEEGFESVVDLGAWWKEETGLPLPLGCNAIRRDLDEDLKRRLSRLLRESIDYGLDHREEALDHALRFARGLEDDRERADRFVGMYVNEWTRRYGSEGREAVRRLLLRGHDAGVLPTPVEPEWISLE